MCMFAEAIGLSTLVVVLVVVLLVFAILAVARRF
jgi:Sec-independent protein translocase protein TatA